MSVDLARLDNELISVELSVNGGLRVFRGIAKLREDNDLGQVIAVDIEDSLDSFELLISPEHWSGSIAMDVSGTAKFRISLQSECACVG